MRMVLPTTKGWCLEVDKPNLNFKAFHAATKANRMPIDYRDKDKAEANAKALTEQLGVRVWVFPCIF